MVGSARIETPLIELERRDEPFRREHRRDTLRAPDGRPLLRRILGPDGVVRTRLARSVVLDAIRMSGGR